MPYAEITVIVDSVLERSFWFRKPGRTLSHNIGRSLLHGGDDMKLERVRRDKPVKLRVMKWKAREMGFSS